MNKTMTGAGKTATADNRRLWKISRIKCLCHLLHKKKIHSFADIGAGDMSFTSKLPNIASGKVYAVDIGYAEQQVAEDNIICLNNISKLPENEVDCLIMMDVLEHVEDDRNFLRAVVEKLKSGGNAIVTVPAIQHLFSPHDAVVGHYRRYNRKRLLALLKQSDLTVEKCHYFYTSLLVVKFFFFLRKKKLPKKQEKAGIFMLTGRRKMAENSITARMIVKFLNIDFQINALLDKIHIHLPGLSILAVCRKKLSESGLP
jgi:ubiquinone/menaquinone biosynthesis C-methylase UbiE